MEGWRVGGGVEGVPNIRINSFTCCIHLVHNVVACT